MKLKCPDCDGFGEIREFGGKANVEVLNDPTSQQCDNCKGTGINPEAREKLARIICCFSEDNENCAECKENTTNFPFPDCFEDIRIKTDQILQLLGDEQENIDR